jgi:ubiquinone/menaquinone biosynthesis C-methylase UbiE
MGTHARWQEAQHAESEYWTFLAAQEAEIERVLGVNDKIARRLREWIPSLPASVLEIGVGGLGVGVIGYLPEIPERIGLDPLPPPALQCSPRMQARIEALRRGVRLLTAPGEKTSFADGQFGLVVCCNVLDHVRDPQAVVNEVHRVLSPGGYFYLDVDVFSLAGLAKWYFWTKHTHSQEILVRAHPHRFREHTLLNYLDQGGFGILKKNDVSLSTSLLGHSWDCRFLAQKPAP